jgi:hypothetical protein
MIHAKSSRPAVAVMLSLARWVARGTMASVAYWATLALILGFPYGFPHVALYGAAFGICGGPVFGLAIWWVDEVGRARLRGTSWRTGAFALAGAVVFGLIPPAINLLRDGSLDVNRHNLGDVIFSLAAMAAAGAFLAWMVASLEREPEEKKCRNGWSELEL